MKPKSFGADYWANNYIKTLKLKRYLKKKECTESLLAEKNIHLIIKKGLKMTSIQSRYALKDLKSFLRNSGQMWDFVGTPIYLQCGVAAAAYFNNCIQDEVRTREEKRTKRPTFFNISLPLATKLVQQLYPKRNITTQESKVYRCLCNQADYERAERSLQQKRPKLPRMQEKDVVAFLRNFMRKKIDERKERPAQPKARTSVLEKRAKLLSAAGISEPANRKEALVKLLKQRTPTRKRAIESSDDELDEPQIRKRTRVAQVKQRAIIKSSEDELDEQNIHRETHVAQVEQSPIDDGDKIAEDDTANVDPREEFEEPGPPYESISPRAETERTQPSVGTESPDNPAQNPSIPIDGAVAAHVEGGSTKRFIATEMDSSPTKRQRVHENVDNKKFPSINDILTKMNVGDKMEFIGLVVKMEEEESKMTRGGKMSPMRKVLLTDNGEDEIFLTIWGPEKSSVRIAEKSVLFVRQATLIKFNDEKLLTTPRSLVTVNPLIPETRRLKNLPIKTTPVIRNDATVSTTSKNQFFQNRFSTYKFVSITEIETKITLGTKIDFLGLVVKVGDQVPCSGSKGDSMIREITLTDHSGSEIVAPIYSKEFDDSEILPNFVLFLKTAAVVPWDGEKRLSVIRFNVWVNPTIPEAEEIKKLINTRLDAENQNAQTGEKIEDSTSSGRKKCYTPIADILDKTPAENSIHILGVVLYRKPLECKTINGVKSDVLKVVLLDQSERQIPMTISGPSAYLLAAKKSENSIVEGLKILVVNTEGSKKLVCSRISSNVTIDPDNEEARELQRWFENVWCKKKIEEGSPATAAVINENQRGNLLNFVGKKENNENLPNSIVNENQRENLPNSSVEGKKRENLPNSVVEGKKREDLPNSLEDKNRENLPNSVVECKNHEDVPNSVLNENESQNLPNSVKEVERKNLQNSANEDQRENLRNSVSINGNEDLPNSLSNVKFTPIIDIHENIPVDSIINVLGAVHVLGALHIVEYGDGSTSCNRIVTIVDDSQKSIHLRIFNTQARNIESGAIIAVTNVRVCPKKCLVPSINDSVSLVNPLFEKAQKLKKWYKINAIDKPFAEIMLPITSNAEVFEKFNEGDQTSILGILKEKHDLNEIQQSDTQTLANVVDVWRKIELVDHTEVSIAVILWGDKARNFDFPIGSILLITNVRVSVMQQMRFCCCMGLSNIIEHPTETEVVEFVKRLQIWSNVRTLQRLYERPIDMKIVPTVPNTTMNNSIGILMNEIREWYLQVPLKVQPMECLDSETFDMDERREPLIPQVDEEKITIKTEPEESLGIETFTPLETQIDAEEFPSSNGKATVIKEEIDVCDTVDDLPYLTFTDSVGDLLKN